MAIVKATYTKKRDGAKASVRYIAHRPDRHGRRGNRVLFGSDGILTRSDAYTMIDEAEPGTIFFRFAISPDPRWEDTYHDLHMRDITEATMQQLEQQIGKPALYVAAIHADHAPHRHVHVVVCVSGRLNPRDFQAMREAATTAALTQRRDRDQQRQYQQEQEEDRQWE
jgi:hypothetical protein